MKPHHSITPWPTQCTNPGCHRIVRIGESLFFDDTHAYCADCYAKFGHCTECGTTLTSQHDTDTDCWTCANFHNGRNIVFIDGHRVTFHPNPAHPDSPWVDVDQTRRWSFTEVSNAYSLIYAPESR